MRINSETASKSFAELFAEREAPLNFLTEFPPEQNDAIILKHLEFAEKLFPESGLSLCPISHARLKYHSPNSEQILGHPHHKLMKMSLADYFSWVHPEDLPLVQQCFSFIKKRMPSDPEVHRFALYYRFQNDRGEYAHIKNEQLGMRMGEKSYLYLMIYNDVSRTEKFYHVKLDIYKKIKGQQVKIYTYNPQQTDKEITPRQNDIATLVMKGFSNREIADQLCISVYTVKNHKQMLFKKINVKNSVELANYVQRS